MNTGFLAKKSALVGIAVYLMFCAAAYSKDRGVHPLEDCGYYMCSYEKENIDAVILGHARENRTVMFGEIHDSVVAGTPPPLEDSLYVISLLEKLKAIGYSYLALEVQKNAPMDTHSHDILRCMKDYRSGTAINDRNYPYAKPGWIDLMIKALDIGYKPVFYTIADQGADRDAEMFRAIKEQVFDRDARARVLVYVGAGHISQLETQWGFAHHLSKRRPLGLLLNDFTQGKNFSVYIGYPDDTPAGCDLVISSFVWTTFRNALQRLHSQP